MEIRTLIVDDESDVRFLVGVLIEQANNGVLVSGSATDGPDALRMIDEADPVVVVLDQNMPGMTGIETARLIRMRRPHVAMILFSAYLEDALRAEALAVGFTACVRKDDVVRLPEIIKAAALAS